MQPAGIAVIGDFIDIQGKVPELLAHPKVAIVNERELVEITAHRGARSPSVLANGAGCPHVCARARQTTTPIWVLEVELTGHRRWGFPIGRPRDLPQRARAQRTRGPSGARSQSPAGEPIVVPTQAVEDIMDSDDFEDSDNSDDDDNTNGAGQCCAWWADVSTAVAAPATFLGAAVVLSHSPAIAAFAATFLAAAAGQAEAGSELAQLLQAFHDDQADAASPLACQVLPAHAAREETTNVAELGRHFL